MKIFNHKGIENNAVSLQQMFQGQQSLCFPSCFVYPLLLFWSPNDPMDNLKVFFVFWQGKTPDLELSH